MEQGELGLGQHRAPMSGGRVLFGYSAFFDWPLGEAGLASFLVISNTGLINRMSLRKSVVGIGTVSLRDLLARL